MQKIEQIASKYTPELLKKFCLKVIGLLPERISGWILNNKGKAIIIFFTFRGLFLRPSMWAVYFALFAYFTTA
jgi:hypothetical protein